MKRRILATGLLLLILLCGGLLLVRSLAQRRAQANQRPIPTLVPPPSVTGAVDGGSGTASPTPPQPATAVGDPTVTTTAVPPAASEEPPAMPPLRVEGDFVRDPAGRSTLLRGADYAYNTIGIIDLRFDIDEHDMAQIASWGMNTLRIRIRDHRAGLYPGTEAEAGYLEGLDRLVRQANEQGLYVIIALGGPESLTSLDRHPESPLFDQAKFLPGNPAHTRWLAYLDGFFSRYADWPGVIGFDPINEDIAFPPEIHDAIYMREQHLAALALLRERSPEKIYFQQPAGWIYQGFNEPEPHDLGDSNRIFCTKWALQAAALPPTHVDRMLGWAERAGAPLVVCEYLIFNVPFRLLADRMAFQRQVLHHLDTRLIGRIRLGYMPFTGSSLVTESHEPTLWVAELVRPYPLWIGGEPRSIQYDYDALVLTVDLLLDGSGPTELFIPADFVYPGGFEVVTDGGDRIVVTEVESSTSETMGWEPDRSRLTLAPSSGPLRLEVRPVGTPRPPDPRAFETGSDFQGADPPEGVVTTTASIPARLTSDGSYTPAQAECIERELSQRLEAADLTRFREGRAVPHTAAEEIGWSVHVCISAP